MRHNSIYAAIKLWNSAKNLFMALNRQTAYRVYYLTHYLLKIKILPKKPFKKTKKCSDCAIILLLSL